MSTDPVTSIDAPPPPHTSFWIALLVGIASGSVGPFILLRRMALVGDALSHVALPGIALALIYRFDPFLRSDRFPHRRRVSDFLARRPQPACRRMRLSDSCLPPAWRSESS
jgi:hypothetical protein